MAGALAGSAGETEGSQSPHPPTCPIQPCRDALIHLAHALGPRKSLVFFDIIIINTKEGRTLSSSWPHEPARALHVGAFKAPPAPRQGEATTQTALFLLPETESLYPHSFETIQAQIEKEIRRHSKIANIRGVREHSVTGSSVLFPQARPASPAAGKEPLSWGQSHQQAVSLTNRTSKTLRMANMVWQNSAFLNLKELPF